MASYQHISHGFEPVFDERSRILVLGSFPSVLSRENAFYYGNPQNRFWRVLPMLYGEAPLVGDIPKQKEFLTRHHIALWDVLDSCEIQGASDASIRNPVPNRMREILDRAPIEAIFCTGQKAGTLFKRYCQKDCAIQARVLPSTSPANCAVKLEQLLERYAVIRQITDRRKQTKP